MAATMKAWQYSSPSGALDTKLQFATEATKPTLNATKPQMLVEVISMGLNPADYKLAEMGMLGNVAVSKPASPGMDFSGRVVTLGQATDVFKVGDVVLGRIDPTQFGTLGQFVIASYDGCAVLPKGVEPDHGAGIGTAGQTAYQTIVPNVKAGDKIFINGGSGAVGAFGIQIAKAVGCHVTVSCSSAKIELCKQHGADEVIDYTSTDVTQKLVENGLIYSLVVDNVGNSPGDLYTKADKFLSPAGKFVQVGGSASLESARIMSSRMLLPKFLGGGSRKFVLYFTKNSRDDLAQIAEWVAEGKVKVPIEEVFEYEDAPKAIALLKKGKSKGKIIVHVGQKS
ncbi:related to zinc alcohol dehydrogenase [Rhynchosporium agropyri]|uniref:Related to zinc alcohol dehydrogenase n=2 Tax=Rhynchosporium TaxID=38037 RepID=A0A1E1KNQ6_9HELO|nr:related to zinc alcohol dehydrogenase [Rhynchosporium commune]CZS99658.1 related to zinc alcohol dehydrogenase [Rhynchosporium agropyri]